MRVKIQKAVAAANGADGAFKEKIINGVKQQPAAACKKCQQKQNKVVNFFRVLSCGGSSCSIST